jgi:hypothetical protein
MEPNQAMEPKILIARTEVVMGVERLSPEEFADIAEEAYIFSFPMLMGYRYCFATFLVPSLPSYRGPMNLAR